MCASEYTEYCTVEMVFPLSIHCIVVDCCYHSFDIKANVFAFSFSFPCDASAAHVIIVFDISKFFFKKKNNNFFLLQYETAQFLIRSMQMRYANDIHSCSIKWDQLYDISKYHSNGKHRLNESRMRNTREKPTHTHLRKAKLRHASMAFVIYSKRFSSSKPAWTPALRMTR